MSMENLTHVLTGDLKYDLEKLRRMYIRKRIKVDGRTLVNSCDTYSFPVIRVDTCEPHTIWLDGKTVHIPKRTNWKNEFGKARDTF